MSFLFWSAVKLGSGSIKAPKVLCERASKMRAQAEASFGHGAALHLLIKLKTPPETPTSHSGEGWSLILFQTSKISFGFIADSVAFHSLLYSLSVHPG